MLSEQQTLWLASFPKSGNTWVASVLSAAGCEFGYSRGKYAAYHLQAKGEDPRPCNAVNSTVVGANCSILKTHSPYVPSGLPHQFSNIKPVTAGYIHIFRNPLDVLLSYIGFTRLEYGHRPDDEWYRQRLFVDMLGFDDAIDADKWRSSSIDQIPRENLDHALDKFSREGLSIPTLDAMSGSWGSHLRSWRSAAKSLPGCSLRYEDCLIDAVAFAPISKLLMISAADVVKSVKSVNARVEDAAAGGSERDRIFFNKRSAYYFYEYFSRSAIDRFFEEHESMLIEAGYGALVGQSSITSSLRIS